MHLHRALKRMGTVFLMVTLVLTIALIQSAGAQQASPGPGTATAEATLTPAEVDEAFKEAFASEDIEAFVTLYAEDAIERNPFGIYVGREEIVSFIEDFFASNTGVDAVFSETEVVHTTAMHRLELSSDPIREAGLDRVIVFHTVVVENGEIVSLTAVFDTTDEQTMRFAEAMAAQADSAATPTS